MAKFQALHNLLIILCLFVSFNLFILFKIIGHSTCDGVLFAHLITLIRVAMFRATLRLRKPLSHPVYSCSKPFTALMQ